MLSPFIHQAYTKPTQALKFERKYFFGNPFAACVLMKSDLSISHWQITFDNINVVLLFPRKIFFIAFCKWLFLTDTQLCDWKQIICTFMYKMFLHNKIQVFLFSYVHLRCIRIKRFNNSGSNIIWVNFQPSPGKKKVLEVYNQHWKRFFFS